MKTVKSILLRLKLQGNGIINYDSNDQKWMLDNTRLRQVDKGLNNITYAKKNLYENTDGGKDVIKLKFHRIA